MDLIFFYNYIVIFRKLKPLNDDFDIWK